MHWHLPAEWAFVLYGSARITGFGQDGRSSVADVKAGDLWNFLSGIPHAIQGLEPDGTEFLLVFDDGAFSGMRREAGSRAARGEAVRVVEGWNKAIAAGRDIWWSPTIRAAIVSGMPWADIYCPGCCTSRSIDFADGRSPSAGVGREPGAGPFGAAAATARRRCPRSQTRMPRRRPPWPLLRCPPACDGAVLAVLSQG